MRYLNQIRYFSVQKKYSSNSFWLIASYSFKMLAGLVTTGAIARYLGPETYGLYNYILSIVAFLQIVSSLGLMDILKKRLIETPHETNQVLSAAFFLCNISGYIVYTSFVSITVLVTKSFSYTFLCSILGFSIVLKSFRCFEIFFQVNLKSKFSFIASAPSIFLFTLIKIYMVYLNASLQDFALFFVLEILFIGFHHLVEYEREYSSFTKLKIQRSVCFSLLKQSWPMLLSGFATTIYMKTDQVMLGRLIGNTAVGEYAAASRLSTIWYVLPVLLSASVATPLIRTKKRSLLLYRKRFQLYLDFNAIIATIIVLPGTLFSPLLIRLVFGSEYQGSYLILSIHIWSCFFLFLGVARNLYVLGEGLFRFSMFSTLASALLNIILNFILIPKFSTIGAASATIVSFFMSSVLFNLFHRKLRNIFYFQIKSFFAIFRIPSFFVRYKELI